MLQPITNKMIGMRGLNWQQNNSEKDLASQNVTFKTFLHLAQ